MRTSFFDFSLLHYDDLVSFSDCAKSVRNNDNSLVSLFDQFVKGLLNLVLTLSIESTGCLIEQKDLRLSNQSPGDCDALFLTTRQFHSALSDHCLIA